jgi:hypothetical protein
MAEDYPNMGGDEGGGGTSAHDDGGDHEEKMEGEEALLPKSILAGKEFNVGDEVVLEITSIKDDEITVKYAKEKTGGDGQEGEDGESEMSQAQGRMGAMTNGARAGGGFGG